MAFDINDPLFVEANIQTESGGNPNAVSEDGAIGLGQFLPATFDQFKDEGDVITNPVDNRKVTGRYLSYLHKKYGEPINDPRLTVALYNWGEGHFDKKYPNGVSSYDEIRNDVPEETRNHVDKVFKKYDKLTGKESNFSSLPATTGTADDETPGEPTAETASLPQPQSAKPKPPMYGDSKAFANAVTSEIDNDEFAQLPLQDQLAKIHDVYKQGNWDDESLGVMKHLADELTEVTPEDERLDISSLVGDAPELPKDTDPNTFYDDWQRSSTYDLLRQGINPAAFGTAYDKHFEDTKKEMLTRNEYLTRGLGASAAQYGANFAREAGKGAVESVTGVISGAASLFGASKESTDTINETSKAIFGDGNRDFLYEMNADGSLKQDEEGNTIPTWSRTIANAIGNIGATLVSGKYILKGAEMANAGIKVGSATIFGKDAIQTAGSTFQYVDERTGGDSNPDKTAAYEAALASMPSSIVGSIGDLAVISRYLSPSLKGLSQANKNAYLARAMAKKAAVGGASEAAADVLQQGANIAFGGGTFNPRSTVVSAFAGTVVSGTFAGVDAKAEQSHAFASQKRFSNEAVKFQKGLDISKVIDVHPDFVDPLLTETLGIEAVPDGANTRLTKQLDPFPIENEEALHQTIQGIGDSVTESDYAEMQQRRGELIQKTSLTQEEVRELEVLDNTLKTSLPDHIKKTRSIEKAISDYTLANGNVIPYVYTDKGWQHAETGETASYLKDLVVKKADANPQQDVSDVDSYADIVDEDDINNPDYLADQETRVNSLQTELQGHNVTLNTLNASEAEKNTQLDTLKDANKINGANNRVATTHNNNLNKDIAATTDKLTKATRALSDFDVDAESKPITVSAAQTQFDNLTQQLNQINEKIAGLQASKPKKTGKSDVQNEIYDLQAQKINLKSTLVKTKNALTEEGAKAAEAERQNKREKKRNKLVRTKTNLEADLNKLKGTPQKEIQNIQDTGTLEKEINDVNNNKTQTSQKITSTKKQHTDESNKLKRMKDARTDHQQKFGKLREGSKLGSNTLKDGRNEILISGGWSAQAKAQLLAHELGHAIHNILKVPKLVTEAILQYSTLLNNRGKYDSAQLLAKNILLPEIYNRTAIPDVPLAKTNKASKDALTSPRELFANMTAAYLMEKNGVKTDVDILPEVRDFLSTIKLPEIDVKTGKVKQKQKSDPTVPVLPPSIVPEPNPVTPENPVRTLESVMKGEQLGISSAVPTNPAETPNRVSNVETPIKVIQGEGLTTNDINTTTKQQSELTNNEQSGESVSAEPTSGERGTLDLTVKTGEQGETAFSERIREVAPEIPANMYDKISNIQSQKNARDFVDTVGIEEALNLLEGKGSDNIPAHSAAFLAEATLYKAKQKLGESNTQKNYIQFERARGLRDLKATQGGQGLRAFTKSGMGSAESLGDFIDILQRSFSEVTGKSKELTDFARGKLEAIYKSFAVAKDPIIRDTLLFEAAKIKMNNDGLNWSDFTVSAIRQNYLSGAGSLLTNAIGGSGLGLVYSLASRPFMAPVLLRTMFNSFKKAKVSAQRAFNGRDIKYVTDALDSDIGNYKPSVFFVRDTSTAGKRLASTFNAVGQRLLGLMQAADAFNRTIIADTKTRQDRLSEIREMYKGDQQKISSEYAKLWYDQEAVNNTLKEMHDLYGHLEGITEGDLAAAAYEKLSPLQGTDQTFKENVQDWTDLLSLRHNPRNPLLQFIQRGLDRSVNDSKIARTTKALILPFSRAMLNLMEIGFDVIPGSAFIDKGMLAMRNHFEGGEPKTYTKAQIERQRAGQLIGATMVSSIMAMLAEDMIEITGEAEKTLDKSSGERVSGDTARTGQDRAEFLQTEKPEFSFRVGKKGTWISYRDHPWAAPLLYGAHKALNRWNQSDKNYSDALEAGVEFYMKAGTQALGLTGGQGVFKPYADVVDKLFEEDTPFVDKLGNAAGKLAENVSKAVIPFSGALRDIKKIYDDTPENYHQNAIRRIFKDYPLLSEMSGSQSQLNVFGEEVQRPIQQRVPGLGRLGGLPVEFTPLQEQLYQRGLVVPELPNKLRITKGDAGDEATLKKFTQTPGNRLNKALGDVYTPDEYRAFVKATGSQIARVAREVINRNVPTAQAQQEIMDRVKDIRKVAKQRYIRTGKFE